VNRLRAANLALAVLHGGQAVLIVVLGASLAIPITAQWADGPPGSALGPTEALFDLPVRWCVAAFLLLAALDHLLVASPGIVSWYERNLGLGINYARWIEYSFSASLMIVLIATFAGVTDIRALVAVAGVNAAMILFGLLMERANRPGEPVDWRPFVYGSIVGAAPWLAIAVQLGHAESEADVPGFVIAIFVTLFVLFSSFAVNMALQYLRVGPWRTYLFGERMYLVLSLVAKSALAWQVFAGALAD
jgi:hypothetical protein